MAVYVDDPRWLFRRMMMCHMIADSSSELIEMADKIGVQRQWIEFEGTAQEHFGISESKRAIAIKNGAIEISPEELFLKIRNRRPIKDDCND